MVSNARLDFPDPDRPVTTMSLSRGSSSDTFLRLWTRAPWTAMVVRATGLVVAGLSLADIGQCSGVGLSKERDAVRLELPIEAVAENQFVDVHAHLLHSPIIRL